MALQITSATPDEVTLTPAPVGCIRWIIGGFGVLGLLMGSGVLAGGRLLATSYPAGADFANLLAVVFAVMGTGFMVQAFFIGGPAALSLATLVFDQRLGAVRVRCAAGQPAEAYIRYADIAGLDVETRSHTSSAGNSGHSSSSRTYTHHVVLRLTDGAKWVLTEDSTRDAADAQLAQLAQLAAALLPGAAGGGAVPPPQLPPQVVQRTEGTGTALRWQNSVSGREVAGNFLVLGFFGVVLVLFLLMVRTLPLPGNSYIFAYAVLGFIAAVFVFIAVQKLRRLRQDARNRYALGFGPADITYLEESLTTGAVTHRVVVPLAEWYGLSYAYDATGQENEAVLLLSKAAHEQYLHQQKAGLTLKEGLGLLLEKEQSRALYFKAFSPTQRLAVVNWVRAETARRLAPR